MVSPSFDVNNNRGLVQILLFLKHSKKIEGKTKFQKMVFLAQKENKLSEEFKFIKYNYGPYSFDLTKSLEALETTGFITVEKEEFETDGEFPGKKFIFQLTEDGEKLIESEETKEEDSKIIKNVVEKWNNKPMEDIIKYVYSKYM
jgi:hypothetical protein